MILKRPGRIHEIFLNIQGYPQRSDCKDDLQLYKHDDFKVELNNVV